LIFAIFLRQVHLYYQMKTGQNLSPAYFSEKPALDKSGPDHLQTMNNLSVSKTTLTNSL